MINIPVLEKEEEIYLKEKNKEDNLIEVDFDKCLSKDLLDNINNSDLIETSYKESNTEISYIPFESSFSKNIEEKSSISWDLYKATPSQDLFQDKSFHPFHSEKNESFIPGEQVQIIDPYNEPLMESIDRDSEIFTPNSFIIQTPETFEDFIQQFNMYLVDDYWTLENGKSGWVCFICKNFNYESEGLI